MANKTLADNPKPAVQRKLEEFADLYRGGPDDVRGNAARCYMALHPRCKSVGTAEVKGAEYLKHRIVQERIREKTDAVAEQADIRQEQVLKEIARLALFDPRKLLDSHGNPLPIHKLDADTAAAVGVKVTLGAEDVGVVIDYKVSDKNMALEKLMKHLGLYEQDNKQKHESLADALMAGINRVKGLDE